jgi:adenylate kinase
VAVAAGKEATQLTNSEAHHIPAPAEEAFLPGPVLLLGAPGVGKGTQAQLLMAEFGIPQISTGDLLREHRARHTKLGLLAEELMSQGQLVPDDLVNDMVADRLTHPDALRGYILDGFPRTLPQATWLDNHLAEQGAATQSGPVLPVVAISITVDYDELLHRITGRRTCPVCKSIYNIFSNPPKVARVCDIEGATLVQRSDDTEEVFTERMKTFNLQTAPVVEHYRAQGRFEEIDGNQPVEQVTAAITAALKRLRKEQV